MLFDFIEISGIKLFQPDTQSRESIREWAENKLRLESVAGEYFGATANGILKNTFNIYHNRLLEDIKSINTKNCLVFILYLYEESGKLSDRFKEGKLTLEEENYWIENGALFRQTCDFLCDLIIQSSDAGASDNVLLETRALWRERFSKVWTLAKMSVELASQANLAHMLFPDSTVVRIYPKESVYFIQVGDLKNENDDCLRDFPNRSKRNILLRKKYLGDYSIEHDFHNYANSEHLNLGFQDSFGFTYADYSFVLTSIHQSVKPITDPSKIPAMKLSDFELQLSEYGLSKEAISNFVNLIILGANNFEDSKREIWNFRQENRVSKRPLLKYNYDGETWLLWSNKKLSEYFTLLDLEVSYNTFSKDRRSKSLNLALSRINNENGKKFEKLAAKLLSQVSITGKSYSRNIKSNNHRLTIPQAVGEIDFLGIDKKTGKLVLYEFKMNNTGFEARGFRKDISDYTGKNGYLNSFSNKVQWVRENLNEVSKMIAQNESWNDQIIGLEFAFLTHFNSIASCFINDVRCLTIYELLDEKESQIT